MLFHFLTFDLIDDIMISHEMCNMSKSQNSWTMYGLGLLKEKQPDMTTFRQLHHLSAV